MLLEEWMRSRDGVAHTTDVYAVGFSKYAVAALIKTGRMFRIRRSWLVLKDCGAHRIAAATVGGRLTCVSEAQRIGLWVPAHKETHVAVSPTAARLDTAGLRVHWSTGPAPFAARATVDPIINVLYHVARCLAMADALAVWESALNKKLVAPEVLQQVQWRSQRASRLASIATELSDSGLESHFVRLMRAIGVNIRQQVWIDGHYIDALIGARLIVQLDGFAHHSSAGDRRRDIAADAQLALRGYTVLRFDYYQVMFQPEQVQETVRAANAQGLHLAA